MLAHVRRDPEARPESHTAKTLRVLIVEDAAAVSALLEAGLRSESMATAQAGSGAQALAAKLNFAPDVVLIDLGLPDMDGVELVERFAQQGDCGVIVVSMDASELVRVQCLEAGADDYLVKPVAMKELAARIRAVHRRLGRQEQSSPSRRAPRVTLDGAHRCLSGPGRIVTPLTEAEFAALETLVESDGASVSRDWLGRVALKRPLGVDDRSVDQLVLKLRRKLALHGITDRAILSSRGLGYVIPEPGRFLIAPTDGRG